MKTTFIAITTLTAMMWVGCSQEEQSAADLLKDEAKRSEIMHAIMDDHHMMGEWMAEMKKSNHAMMMMKGNHEMMHQMMEGDKEMMGSTMGHMMDAMKGDSSMCNAMCDMMMKDDHMKTAMADMMQKKVDMKANEKQPPQPHNHAH